MFIFGLWGIIEMIRLGVGIEVRFWQRDILRLVLNIYQILIV